MKRLADWRNEQNLSRAALAKRLQVHPSAVARYEKALDHKDFQVPRSDVMRRIYVMTAGQVQPNDFYDLPALDGDAGGAACPPAQAAE